MAYRPLRVLSSDFSCGFPYCVGTTLTIGNVVNVDRPDAVRAEKPGALRKERLQEPEGLAVRIQPINAFQSHF